MPYADIRSESDVSNASTDLFPGILKVLRFGYDAKGQARVSGKEACLSAFRRLEGEPCVLEKQMALESERSILLTRLASGEIKRFLVAENHHRHGILDCSVVSGPGAANELSVEVAAIAEKIAVGMDYVGTLSVEFFVVDDQLYVNEMAPRPHKSGHFALDACLTNQFEQQVRALCGLLLGDPAKHSAAVMVNLLGDIWFFRHPERACEPDWGKLLAYPGLTLHLYGKHNARPGRKMGHFTVFGASFEKPYLTAMAARAAIGITDS